MRTMPRIHIEKQNAQIGIKTTNAQMQITSNRPKMKLKAPVPQMRADAKQPAFKVDWQRVRSESGLAGPITKSKQLASEGAQQALQYTGEAVNDGNFLARTELGGNRVAALEANRSIADMPEVNLGSMPQSLPNVQWEPGYIHITWSNTQMQVEWDNEFMPTFSVEPHSVEIYLRNRPYIKITVTEDPVSAMGLVDEQV